MLTKPSLAKPLLIEQIWQQYAIRVRDLTFLPLGNDVNTAVYQMVSADNAPYFLKLRFGNFDPTAVLLPQHLHASGVEHIIPPIATQTGQPWAETGDYKIILSPFVGGQNGFESTLTAEHWAAFGRTVRQIHDATFPPSFIRRLRREQFSDAARQSVLDFLEMVESAEFANSAEANDPIARDVVALLQAKRGELEMLVANTRRLAAHVKAQNLPFIVCHSDIHAGNLLIDANNHLFVVDWDEVILAPKERDLMFVSSGLHASGRSPEEEERLFYAAYGDAAPNAAALTYYRLDRILIDVMEYCKSLLLSTDGDEDRPQSLYYLRSNFESGGTIEVTHQMDRSGLITTYGK